MKGPVVALLLLSAFAVELGESRRAGVDGEAATLEFIKGMFRFYDTDANGEITKEEMQKVLKKKGMSKPDAISKLYFKNGTSAIKVGEFEKATLLNYEAPSAMEETVMMWFPDVVSIDGDRSISTGEMETYLYKQGLQSDKIQQVINAFNTDDDREISVPEIRDVFLWAKSALRAEMPL